MSDYIELPVNIFQQQTMIPSLPDLLKVKLLLTSDDKNDLLVANKILDSVSICCADKNDLIEELNQSHRDWHFFYG